MPIELRKPTKSASSSAVLGIALWLCWPGISTPLRFVLASFLPVTGLLLLQLTHFNLTCLSAAWKLDPEIIGVEVASISHRASQRYSSV